MLANEFKFKEKSTLNYNLLVHEIVIKES